MLSSDSDAKRAKTHQQNTRLFRTTVYIISVVRLRLKLKYAEYVIQRQEYGDLRYTESRKFNKIRKITVHFQRERTDFLQCMPICMARVRWCK